MKNPQERISEQQNKHKKNFGNYEIHTRKKFKPTKNPHKKNFRPTSYPQERILELGKTTRKNFKPTTYL